jgi:creatinine amidohydrolase
MPPVSHWRDLAYPQHEAGAGRRRVALLPVGALEAHGPHLPVGTDLVIAEAMARAAAAALEAEGFAVARLPALAWTPAPFADEFAGTLSVRPETTTALVVDVARALAARGYACLGLANAHFDPANLAALAAARDEIERAALLRLAWPELTRRALAARLTEEFRSGACHAGRYETSIMLAERPDLVDESLRHGLPENPVSLVDAIRAGRETFRQAGGPQAYFGAPALASRAEGEATVARLGELLAEAVRAAFARGAGAETPP